MRTIDLDPLADIVYLDADLETRDVTVYDPSRRALGSVAVGWLPNEGPFPVIQEPIIDLNRIRPFSSPEIDAHNDRARKQPGATRNFTRVGERECIVDTSSTVVTGGSNKSTFMLVGLVAELPSHWLRNADLQQLGISPAVIEKLRRETRHPMPLMQRLRADGVRYTRFMPNIVFLDQTGEGVAATGHAPALTMVGHDPGIHSATPPSGDLYTPRSRLRSARAALHEDGQKPKEPSAAHEQDPSAVYLTLKDPAALEEKAKTVLANMKLRDARKQLTIVNDTEALFDGHQLEDGKVPKLLINALLGGYLEMPQTIEQLMPGSDKATLACAKEFMLQLKTIGLVVQHEQGGRRLFFIPPIKIVDQRQV